jgi:hypothetical protein
VMTRDGARRRSMAPISAGRVQLAALVRNMGKDARCRVDSPLEETVSSEPVSGAQFPVTRVNTGNFVKLELHNRSNGPNRP